MAYTTTDLLSGVKRLGFLPDASDLTDADLLAFGDEEQASLISGEIKTEREEHYVVTQDYALDGVTKSYTLPRRAMGRMVRGVSLISPAGIACPCPAIDPASGWYGSSATATAYCHSITNDQITMPGPGPSGWTLRVLYLRRASRLTPVSEGAAIVKYKTSTGVTVDTVPSWVTAIGSGETSLPIYVDIVRGDAPFDLSYVDLIAYDYNVGSLVISFTTSISAGDFVNRAVIINDRVDYVCLRDMTVYPTAPSEFFPALEAAVCRRALEAIGDRVGAELVTDTYTKRVQAAVDITSPREETGGRAIVRRGSALRSGGGFGRGRRGWR